MFWNTLYKLCEKNSTKPYIVAKEIGVSNSVCTKWKNGSIPNGETLLKLSNYFDVSIDFLLGRTETPTGYNNSISNVQTTVNSPQVSGNNNNVSGGAGGERGGTVTAEEFEIIELIRKLSLKKRVEFISALYDATDNT